MSPYCWSRANDGNGTFPWHAAQVFDVEFSDTPGMSYDVSADGQRLLVGKRVRPVTTSRIELISNWTDLLERHAPSKK
jgi:hypothetical protein